MFSSAYFLVLCFLISVDSGPSPRKPECSKRRVAESDVCASKLFVIGNRGSKIPRNTKEMNVYCGTVRNAGKCIRHYANQCLPPFPKQLSSILHRAVENSSAELCNTPQSQHEFMTRASCVNNGIESMNQCMEKYIDKLGQVKKADSRNKIAFVCCTSQTFRNCMEEELAKICVQDSYSYLHNMVMSYAREVLETLCGMYSGPGSKEKCDRLPALPPREGRSTRILSPYTPIMEIFSDY
ncbi:uncharacterized protein LOC141856340 [Brevipalpus obovatus]|uniref:uncharacterized protein LOC141856340 n=1 Tax=Brevipalpus obovatus TaxID=246614 RepID=UPI003D9E7D7D